MDNDLEYIISALDKQDGDKLRKKIVKLKQSDGEGWAIGELLERVLNYGKGKGE